MKTAIYFVILCACGRIDFDPIGDSSAACPAGYADIEGGCFLVMINLMPEVTWTAAEAVCEQEGAHHVVIDSREKFERVRRLVPSGLNDFWIGATDRRTEGTYLAVTGGPAFMPPWGGGEPDGGPQDCLLVTVSYELTDDDCDSPDDYICEYDGIPADPTSY